MRLKLLDRYQGEGWLSREDGHGKIMDVQYDIAIYQEMRDVGGGNEIPRMKRIEGTVTPIEDDPHGIALAPLVSESLVLHMADGRKLGMFITHSKTGSIANRTGFF